MDAFLARVAEEAGLDFSADNNESNRDEFEEGLRSWVESVQAMYEAQVDKLETHEDKVAFLAKSVRDTAAFVVDDDETDGSSSNNNPYVRLITEYILSARGAQ